MCYHTSLNVPQPALEARYGANLEEGKNWQPVIHANAYSVPAWPLVRVQQPEVLSLLEWGLIPHWTKAAPDAKKLRTMTINCRHETMFEKPAFRSAGGAALPDPGVGLLRVAHRG